jgi:hypothetical protein
MVRLRHPDLQMEEPDDIAPELLLTNSHDWTSRLSLAFGLYRYVCANGLIVADYEADFFRLRHSSIDEENILAAAQDVADRAPMVGRRIRSFQSTHLSDEDRMEFATRGLALRWQDGRNPAPIPAERLLESRRAADYGSDLWTVYNVVQENIMRGGIEGVAGTSEFRTRRRTKTVRADGTPVALRKTTTRPVSSIVRAEKINRGLWTIADDYAERSRIDAVV